MFKKKANGVVMLQGAKRRRNLLSAYDMSGVRRALEDGDATGTLVKSVHCILLYASLYSIHFGSIQHFILLLF